MSRTLALLVVVLVLVGVGYGVMLAVIPESRPWGKEGAPPPRMPAGAPGSQATIGPSEYETIEVALEIPAAKDVPTGGAHGGNCPQDRLGNIFGVTFATTHGLVVGTVVPDGPAAKAGIKPGDMLGEPTDCPNTSLPRFEAGSEPRTVHLNVKRPKGSSEGQPAEAEETGSGEPEASGE